MFENLGKIRISRHLSGKFVGDEKEKRQFRIIKNGALYERIIFRFHC